MQLIRVILMASSTLFAGMAFAAPTGEPLQRVDGVAAPGQIYCCDDANGRKACGDFLPDACQSRAYEIRDSRGFVSRKIEAPLTAEQQARRLADNARKAEEQKRVTEERRRTQALLSTYASPADIDRARDRELAEADKSQQQAQQRLDEATQKSAKIEREKEFYKGKALPPQVKAQIRDNEAQIKAQQAAVASKLKEKDEIGVKYAEEKRRFIELTGKKSTATTPSLAQPPALASGPKPAEAK